MTFWLSAAVFAASLVIYGNVARGWRKLAWLRDIARVDPANAPLVSLVVPARNEARDVEAAMRSLLALDYPALEVIAIDDRSTDETGAILDRLAAESTRLQVLHVRDLPAGWLGKNHALHEGAKRARGEYILFIDADVVLAPSALARAIAHCRAQRLEHLTVWPEVPMPTLFLRLCLLSGFVGLLAMYRPWRAQSTGKHGLGVGAFNMVRAAAYREAGGHAAIAMQVLDDIELGRLMAQRHYRQDLVIGADMVSVFMYRSATEMFRGVQKNVFTFLDYSTFKLVGATLLTFALAVWPWLGVVITDGTTRALNAATIALVVALYVWLAPQFKYSRWCAAYLPANGVLTIFLLWQVAILTWVRGGVLWRGTLYPLAELRKKKALGV